MLVLLVLLLLRELRSLPAPPACVPPPPSLPAPPQPPPPPARCKIESHRHIVTIGRSTAERLLSSSTGLDPPSTRFVHAVRDGRAIGIKLYGRRLEWLGFRSGDLIVAINGYSITTPEEALSAYAAQRNETWFAVDIERDGFPMCVMVDIVGAGRDRTSW
jgi:hypothetical protein